ncbi:MAG: DNA-processing protein DprA [Lachnospiraceae bacterium]|nr:DNA-processing protein DprA [Lachnospiraceae bacterium]
MTQNEREKQCACWLDSISFITSANKYRLLAAAKTAEGIYNMKETDISYIVGEKNAALISRAKKLQSPELVSEKLHTAKIRHTSCLERDFPARLRNIPDPPFGLFYRGELPKDTTPAVAIIGARKCSEYGYCMATRLAGELGKRGVNIISGMALGIDGIGQRAALDAGARSYAVLGCGADVVYPKSNMPLYERLVKEGGVMSEYPPGTAPKPMLFPPRNRIISALSDAVLVVEAREKSGTLITVDMALEQGREVFVVPGRCTDGLSAGCNRLLRQGASAVMCAEDVINDMGWDRLLPAAEAEKGKSVSSYIKELSPLAAAVCGLLDILPVTCDTIIMLLREQGFKESAAQISAELLGLELKGIIEREGGQYKLKDEIAIDK